MPNPCGRAITTARIRSRSRPRTSRRSAWSGQAVLDRYTAQNDWEAARLCVAQNLRAKLIDSETANRQKAVLDTAHGDGMRVDGPGARHQTCCAPRRKKRPDLVPATALLARLLSRRGDFRAASKLIEAAYAKGPHPDLAKAYVEIRHGDSSADRLARAKALAKLAPNDPESAMMIATAALGRARLRRRRATPWRL